MNNVSQSRYMISSFDGLNVHERIGDGQWSDMLNMTADEYPTAKTRGKRIKLGRVEEKLFEGDKVFFAYLLKNGDWAESLEESDGIEIYYSALDNDAEFERLNAFDTPFYLKINFKRRYEPGMSEPVEDPKEYKFFVTEKKTYEAERGVGFVVKRDAFGRDEEYYEFYYRNSAALVTQGESFEISSVVSMFPGKPVDAAVVDDKIFIACNTGIVAQGENAVDVGQEIKQIVPFGRDLFISPGGYLLKNDFSDLTPVRLYASMLCDVTLCNSESEDIEFDSSDTVPENPENGAYRLDTTNNGLYRYSAIDEMWRAVTEQYIKFSIKDIDGEDGGIRNLLNFGIFKAGDALLATGSDGENTIEENFIVHSVGADGSYMTVEGYIKPKQSMEWIFERRLPVFDFVCEHNNRIWGCRYGENDKGEFVNEIYASALGDPTNFFVFEGTAADSYMASVGHAGEWTGCISTEEYVLFFKRDAVFIVSGSTPGTFTVAKIGKIGVQKGSEKSLKEIGGYVYYKSDHGFMRINPGGFPMLISSELGADNKTNAIAGTNGTKYYISLSENGERKMFIYDISLGAWSKEDEPTDNLCAFVTYRNDLLAIGGKENPVTAKLYKAFDSEAAENLRPKREDYGTFDFVQFYADLLKWAARVTMAKIFGSLSYFAVRHLIYEMGKGKEFSDISEVPEERVQALYDSLTGALYYLKKEHVYCCDAEIVFVNAGRRPEKDMLKLCYYTAYLEEATITPDEMNAENEVQWSAETGVLGLSEPDFKRIREIQIRIKADSKATFKTEIMTDESGKWQELYSHTKGKAGTNRIVYSPAERIETFRLRFSGIGETVIYSITYTTENGGNYVY